MSARESPPRPNRWRRWSNTRFFNDVVLAIMVGLVVAGIDIGFSEWRENQRIAEAQRVENLRHVRDLSATGAPDERLFAHLDLSGLPMSGLNLSGADLRFAKLDDTTLDGARLSGSNLSGASLVEARLVGVDLSDVEATCIDLDDESPPRCADFTEALMQDANLSGANLSGANLSGANLSGANLDGANLDGTVLAEVIHSCEESTIWPQGFSPPDSAPCP